MRINNQDVRTGKKGKVGGKKETLVFSLSWLRYDDEKKSFRSCNGKKRRVPQSFLWPDWKIVVSKHRYFWWLNWPILLHFEKQVGHFQAYFPPNQIQQIGPLPVSPFWFILMLPHKDIPVGRNRFIHKHTVQVTKHTKQRRLSVLLGVKPSSVSSHFLQKEPALWQLYRNAQEGDDVPVRVAVVFRSEDRQQPAEEQHHQANASNAQDCKRCRTAFG